MFMLTNQYLPQTPFHPSAVPILDTLEQAILDQLNRHGELLDLSDLSDGHWLASYLLTVDSEYFCNLLLPAAPNASSNWILKAAQLKRIYLRVSSFLESRHHLNVSLLPVPDLNRMAQAEDKDQAILLVGRVLLAERLSKPQGWPADLSKESRLALLTLTDRLLKLAGHPQKEFREEKLKEPAMTDHWINVKHDLEQQLGEEREEGRARLAMAMEDIAVLESELKRERGLKEQLEQASKRLELENQSLSLSNVKLIERIDELESQQLHITGDTETFEAERNALVLQRTTPETERHALATERSALETAKTAFEAERMALTSEKSKLESWKVSMEAEMKALEVRRQELMTMLESEKELVERERLAFKREQERLAMERVQHEQCSKDHEVEALRADLAQASLELESYKHDFGRLRVMHELLEQEHEMLINDYDSIRRDQLVILNDRTRLEQGWEESLIEQGNLRRQLDSLQVEHLELKQSTAELESEISELTDQLQKARGDYDHRIQEMLAQYEEQETMLRAEYTDREQALRSEYSEREEAMVAEHSKLVESLRAEFSVREQTLFDEFSERENALQAEYEGRTTNEVHITQLQQQLAKLRVELEEQVNLQQTWKEKLSMSEQELAKAKAELRDLTEGLNAVQCELDLRKNQESNVSGQVAKLESEKEELIKQLAETKVECDRLSKEMEELFDAQVEEMEANRKKFDDYEQTIGDKCAELERLQADLKASQDKAFAYIAEIEDLKLKLAESEKALAEAKAQVEEKEAALAEAKAQVEEKEAVLEEALLQMKEAMEAEYAAIIDRMGEEENEMVERLAQLNLLVKEQSEELSRREKEIIRLRQREQEFEEAEALWEVEMERFKEHEGSLLNDLSVAKREQDELCTAVADLKADLEAQLDSKNECISKFNLEMAERAASQQELQADYSALQTSHVELEAKYAAVDHELQVMEKNRDQLEMALKQAMEMHGDDRESRQRDHAQAMASLVRELHETRVNRDAIKDSLDRVAMELERMQLEQEGLEAKLAAEQERCASLMLEKQSLQTLIDSGSVDQESLQQELSRLKQELALMPEHVQILSAWYELGQRLQRRELQAQTP